MRNAEAKREKMIGVWLSAEEYERVRVLAFTAKKAVGTYVRDVVLARKNDTKTK